MKGLAGSVAVITGAAGGMGLGAARRLAEEGASVVLIDRNLAAVEAVAAELGSASLAVGADVSSEAEVDRYMTEAVARFGRVDKVFLNAGISGEWTTIVDGDVADFDQVIAVNLRGVYLGIRAAFRRFREQGSGGSIVTTSSVGGLHAGDGIAPYVAAKHGVIGITKAAAVQGGPLGIRANTIAPALIDTPLMELAEAASPDPERFRTVAPTATPMGRFGTIEEVGALVAFLLSDESQFVNGDVIVIDGGAVADSPVRPMARRPAHATTTN
jgi:NAD(P)-dependent dehydrogenase (short-subunit alcohol dehydrogenase family)